MSARRLWDRIRRFFNRAETTRPYVPSQPAAGALSDRPAPPSQPGPPASPRPATAPTDAAPGRKAEPAPTAEGEQSTRLPTIDLFVGLDFGTAATKVVIRAPYLPQAPATAVAFG